jgi:hypothetical protein
MIFTIRRFSALLLAVLIAGSIALGKTKHDVRFESDTMVNGIMVKHGVYDIRYDEKASTLEILKGTKVVVSAPVHLESLSREERQTQLNFNNNELVSVVFGGESQAIVINTGAVQSGSDQ